MSTEDMSTEEWYFDLRRNIAVPASERGPSEHMLGPYPSRHEAENWKARSEERNEGWDEADAEWDQRAPGSSD